MKKLIACLLVVAMLFTMTGAFAAALGRVEKNNVLRRFLNETDLQTKDIALQLQSGDEATDLVIRADGDTLHLVTRTNNVEDGHIQLNPTGIYVASADAVTLLRFATITTVMQDIVKEVNAVADEAAKSIPEDALPTKAEVEKANKETMAAVNEMAILASAVAAQEQADAATLSSAALAFVGKFKPEYILDVKEEAGSLEVSLRSEAYATALAEAMDELLSNPALAELVDRQAALNGGNDFATIQRQWYRSREATLEAIRSMESSEKIEENGHWVSHFQIGDALPEGKTLMCDADAWLDAEYGEADITVALGFKDEDPLMVYTFAVDPYAYREKLTAGDSMVEVDLDFDENQVSNGKVVTVLEGKEELRADFGQDYLYMKGPKGGFSTSVRETWTGKLRYEFFGETADGKEESFIVDFYQDGDSLVCELNTNESDQPVMFKISRVDKADIKDLSASENINEITADKINAELEGLLNTVIKTANSKGA